ncbi:MAG: S41 family peptidase [Planctomycetota bacterium]
MGRLAVLVLLLATLGIASPAALLGGDRKTYLEDFEFLDETVRAHSAALKSKGIDWKSAAARFRPRFADASSDLEHVRNIMELLAVLEDGHTDVWKCDVRGLPGKFEGCYGGGLWFGFEGGKFVLRGMTEELRDGGQLEAGSVLVTIGEEPAWLAMERDRRRIAAFFGISSKHSLYGSMCNRLLPFGERGQLPLTFLGSDGELQKVTVARFSPSGKSFSPSSVQLPEGVEAKEGAVSRLLEPEWGGRLGYLRITGSMNAETVTAFHAALEELRGMEALLLDCRSMGGGSDGAAWEIAGRFYPEGVDNGRNGRIEASGDWQFDGPIVMLQNETMVSSAETFTWAMSEPGRVVSVGSNTGGWAIIPRVFECPSGLASVRIGVTDRATPMRGIHTEGIGWPPDVTLPLGPVFCARPDPAREIALEVVRVLMAGFRAGEVREDFAALFRGEVAAFRQAGARYAKRARGFKPERLARQVVDDLKAELDMEMELLKLDGAATPDLLGADERLAGLVARGNAAGLGAAASRLTKAVRAARPEMAAQRELLQLLDREMSQPDPKQCKQFLSRHGKGRLGRLLRESLWK